MRSHGVGDHPDKPHLEDDYVVKSYRTKPQAEGQKHSYFLRTNTNRFVNSGASVGPQHSDYSLPSPPSPAAATALSRKRSRVHQCSICHRIFSSGQALGGHKRCHWLASGMTEATLIQNFQEIAAYDHSKSPPLIFKNPAFMATPPPHPSPLDLNFPPLLSQPAGDITKAAARKPETPTRSGYMKLWGTEELSTINTKTTTNTNYHNHHQNSRNNIKFADEKPKMKSPKLSDLKDLKLDGGSASGWLQMGIASSTPALI
nr:zinc finger protein ZAT4-like [Ipomoea batatas]